MGSGMRCVVCSQLKNVNLNARGTDQLKIATSLRVKMWERDRPVQSITTYQSITTATSHLEL